MITVKKLEEATMEITSFGAWLRQRRQRMDLTQSDLARQIGCSVVTIRKLEADERRPSLQVAGLLAAALQIPTSYQKAFVQVARNELAIHRLNLFPDHEALNSTPPRIFARLPSPLNALIGRKQEVNTLTTLLREGRQRLMTVTGPGGVGKTRLVLQVANDLQDHFQDGLYFVALASIQEPRSLLNTVAQAVQLHEQPGNLSLEEQLIHYLRPRQILLVLDNFEQVIAAAPILTTLLTACPRLYCLVTSREALRLQGEQVYGLAPLSLPLQMPSVTVTEALQSSAIQLFVQRAQSVQATFTLTSENVAAVVEICLRLDGLPLALELAAARVKLLPPGMLLAQLTSSPQARFSLLAQGMRDAPARQQTLRQTIDWSYALLTPTEQRLLRRLAIFVGGCTLSALATVCQEETAVTASTLSDIASLLDKSLVEQRAGVVTEARFWLLETIREYGLTLLTEGTELAQLQRMHAYYFVAYAEEAAKHFGGPEQARWFERLAIEAGNLQAIYEWVILHEETELGLRLGCALWRFWLRHGPVREGREKLARLVTLRGVTDYPHHLATLFLGAGELAEAHSDYPATFAALEASLRIARVAEDKLLMVEALNELGKAGRAQGAYGVARKYYEESMDIARASGDEALLVGCYEHLGKLSLVQGQMEIAHTLLYEGLAIAQKLNKMLNGAILILDLGILARYNGDMVQARRYLNESFKLLKELNNEYSLGGYERSELAMVAIEEQDYDSARQHLIQGLYQFAAKNHYWGIAQNFEFLTILAAVQGQQQRAFTLSGAASELRRITQTSAYPHTLAKLNTVLDDLMVNFDITATDAARALGEQMTLEEAIAYACQEYD